MSAQPNANGASATDETSEALSAEAEAKAKEARKAFYLAEINLFLKDRRCLVDRHMTPDEIGSADDRGFLLHRGLLDALAYISREKLLARYDHHIISVLGWDTFFSDNKDGCSTVSAPRLAKLLGHDEQTIRRCRTALVEHHLLGYERRPGLEDRYWPIINRAYAGQNIHPTWWLDATSDPARPRGRPRKNKSGSPTPPDLKREKTPGTSDNPGDIRHPDLSNNPGYQTNNPGYGDFQPIDTAEESRLEFSSEFAKGNKEDEYRADAPFDDANATLNVAHRPNGKGTHSVASFTGNGSAPTEPSARGKAELVPPAGLPSAVLATGELVLPAPMLDEHFAEYHRLTNAWGNKPGAIVLSSIRRDVTDANLRNLLVAHHHNGHRPADIVVALAETLTTCAEVAAAERKGRGGGFPNYFSKTLRGKLDELRLSRIKTEHEMEASTMKLGALGSSIASNKARREQVGTTSAAKPRGDPIEAARERGANAVALEKFCRPLLLRFPNMKDPAGWCVMLADMLADMPEDALAWAARSLRDKCPDQFVPAPAVIRQGLEAYIKRKAELGEKFTEDQVFPDWDPGSRSARMH